MLKLKKILFIASTLCLSMPLATYAEYKEVSMNKSLLNGGFSVIGVDSYYQPASFDTLFTKPVIQKQTDGMKLKGSVDALLSQADKKNKQTAVILEKWDEYKPKLDGIIRKEKQLDELLDYMARLKKVTQFQKKAPNFARLSTDKKKTTENCDPYQIPKCS